MSFELNWTRLDCKLSLKNNFNSRKSKTFETNSSFLVNSHVGIHLGDFVFGPSHGPSSPGEIAWKIPTSFLNIFFSKEYCFYVFSDQQFTVQSTLVFWCLTIQFFSHNSINIFCWNPSTFFLQPFCLSSNHFKFQTWFSQISSSYLPLKFKIRNLLLSSSETGKIATLTLSIVFGWQHALPQFACYVGSSLVSPCASLCRQHNEWERMVGDRWDKQSGWALVVAPCTGSWTGE